VQRYVKTGLHLPVSQCRHGTKLTMHALLGVSASEPFGLSSKSLHVSGLDGSFLTEEQ
jgi:hypothetical protein